MNMAHEYRPVIFLKAGKTNLEKHLPTKQIQKFNNDLKCHTEFNIVFIVDDPTDVFFSIISCFLPLCFLKSDSLSVQFPS